MTYMLCGGPCTLILYCIQMSQLPTGIGLAFLHMPGASHSKVPAGAPR